MNQRRGWNIHTRTQLISVGPALLLTLLLTLLLALFWALLWALLWV